MRGQLSSTYSFEDQSYSTKHLFTLLFQIVSTIGKVQIKCTKEDYRTYQTTEERSGDGECVIEVYGFSADLKTVDLMNQFAGFRKNHLEIIWVNDTHALAVFESPNLGDF